MLGSQMVERGTSLPQIVAQTGVSQGGLRYRLKRAANEPRTDGRSLQLTAWDGYEDAIRAILEGAGDGRLTGRGRWIQARRVFERLTRDYDYPGSYQAVVRDDLQYALDERPDHLLEALTCPVTGTSVREPLERERLVL